ncbi:hypothetical protein J2Y55_001121 [Bosea sp. BE125]|uniref:hypothetical protein n=1 Tax=Bosea sp. BE125 TaxID=2817909 RepID=UPI002855A9FE|nr:hypothetical protein [Bosea sp. BE125]MDR6870121.1 hypothetical protein [Bosea sp. BE125]
MDQSKQIGPQGLNEDFDGSPTADRQLPGRRLEELDIDIAKAMDEFERLTVFSEDTYYRLSHACLFLANAASKRRPERISHQSRDHLIRGILDAQFAVVRRAPDRAAGVIMRGFDGLFVLAAHLAESDEERARRGPDVIRDAVDVVRIMRNCAHNEDLNNRIQQRAANRRNSAVAAIIASSLERAA